MHVNWHWIRQRPHVLAEELSRHHELKLLHFAMYHRSHRSAEPPPFFSAKVLWRVPESLLRQGLLFECINTAMLSSQVRAHAKAFKPDVIWVTHPVFAFALRGLNSYPIVYDCMDDHLAFNNTPKKSLALAESRLVRRANLTIFSSGTLANRVQQRAEVIHAEVVNNGVAENLLNRVPIRCPIKMDRHSVIGYFGTISHWFDWKLILHILNEIPEMDIILAGPIETPIPMHPRIQYVGIIPHASLSSFMDRCNALIMPFIVTPLIEAVDPVKLYEYIASGLPSLAPKYHEAARFSPWVELYEDPDDAVKKLRNLLYQSSADPFIQERREFLSKNSWRVRSRQIDQALKNISGQAENQY